MNNSLKAYVRYDVSGRVIAGSLILSKLKPAVGKWKEINSSLCCNPTTTSSTTAAPLPLRLLFSNIEEVDAVVGDSTNVADWNTYFDLPTYGTPFTSVSVTGDEVKLYGGSDIIIKEMLFDQPDELGTFLLEVDDSAGCIVEVEYDGFGHDNNSGCPNLVSVNFPEVTIIGDYCFGSCISLSLVYLPKTTIAISSCFSSCNSLLELSLPALISAGTGCFVGLSTVLDLPKLETAGDNCFSDYNLTSISLPSLLTAGNSCFLGSNLTSITLPKMTSIGNSCFIYCNNLTSVSLPLCTDIGFNAFYEGPPLTSISIPSCTNLGGSVGDNFVFRAITGNTITLTVPSALMACNAGQPDGDIQYLQARNIVTIVTV